MHSSGPVGRHRQLVLVLEGELYLIPFALLKGSSSNEYLYERFSLIAVPSIGSLGACAKVGPPLTPPPSKSRPSRSHLQRSQRRPPPYGVGTALGVAAVDTGGVIRGACGTSMNHPITYLHCSDVIG